jgi:hypothetical protein
MGDERAEVDHTVIVQLDLVEAGEARDVDQGLNALAHAALQLEDQVGGARYDPDFSALSVQNLDYFAGGFWLDIFVPHKPCSS